MPFMTCKEVWEAECECGKLITFFTGEALDNDIYECICGSRYIIDRFSGHYHKMEDFTDAELIEHKELA